MKNSVKRLDRFFGVFQDSRNNIPNISIWFTYSVLVVSRFRISSIMPLNWISVWKKPHVGLTRITYIATSIKPWLYLCLMFAPCSIAWYWLIQNDSRSFRKIGWSFLNTSSKAKAWMPSKECPGLLKCNPHGFVLSWLIASQRCPEKRSW